MDRVWKWGEFHGKQEKSRRKKRENTLPEWTGPKEEIWPDTKFMTVNVIKQTRCDKYPGSENSVLGKLLHRTMLTNYDYSERLKFWRKYGNVVRKQLNKLKTNYGRGLKEELLNCKLLFEYC